MLDAERSRSATTRPERFSFLFLIGTFVVMALLHLTMLLLAALFTYLTLRHLQFSKRIRKWVAVSTFVILFIALTFGLGHLLNHIVRALPEIADNSIPSIIAWAKQYHVELPFTDYDSLKDLAVDTVKGEARYLASFAKFAREATTQALFLLAGSVVAISLFLQRRVELGRDNPGEPDSLYAQYADEMIKRVGTFYGSFVTVMGAQIIISAINTALTAIFVVVVGLPYAVVVIGVTFFCGLLPVVGNLMSNAVVVSIGFTASPRMALIALIFLVVIHKLEYFLNSKIVGWRIHNPLWLTLLALVIGEKLLGVPGLILAPVVLNYVRLEASRFKPD